MKLFGRLLGCWIMLTASAAASEETVVLLHGLGRTRWSMGRIAHHLERNGFRVINATYPSRRWPLERLATEWLPSQLAAVDPESHVHFVTHSMGAIVLRLWLRDQSAHGGAPANLGRVVMLAPPNSGSELADQLSSSVLYRWCTGPNGVRLGTGSDSLPRSLGRWPQKIDRDVGALGIIAGNRPANPLLAAGLPAPNDGKVSVTATHLVGESDHIVMPYSHTWLGQHTQVLGQITAFLRHGRFTRTQAETDT